MQKSERRKTVLIVQHAPHEHPAALHRALESQGIVTQHICPYRGDDYPSLNQLAGMISLGGPMGANDENEHSWIKPECELLKASVEAGLPTVGICLGGQMMAKALGGRVERHELYELGWFPIELNTEGKKDKILGVTGETPTVYQWHGDTFHLPPHATLLAGSKACARQAYRVGDTAYGFQFHPEADRQLVHEWLAIEGVAEEILEVRKAHGPKTVQDASTQKRRSAKGQRTSLRITTAIASLFRKKEREPLKQDDFERISRWAEARKRVELSFEGSHREITRVQGKIIGLLSIPEGDFVILQESNSLLWPVRTDDIVNIKLVK